MANRYAKVLFRSNFPGDTANEQRQCLRTRIERTGRAAVEGGARKVIGARRMNKLSRIAREIENEGGTCLPVELDVTSRESMDAVVHRVVDT